MDHLSTSSTFFKNAPNPKTFCTELPQEISRPRSHQNAENSKTKASWNTWPEKEEEAWWQAPSVRDCEKGMLVGGVQVWHAWESHSWSFP